MVQLFLGIAGPDLSPNLAGEGGKGQKIVVGFGQVVGSGRVWGRKGIDDPGVLGADLLGGRLVDDRAN